jgi:hypothetical protein
MKATYTTDFAIQWAVYSTCDSQHKKLLDRDTTSGRLFGAPDIRRTARITSSSVTTAQDEFHASTDGFTVHDLLL